MKYLKSFESTIEDEPQVNYYVVAYRPYRVEKDTHLDPITIDYLDYLIEIGQITVVHNNVKILPPVYSIHFLESNTKYIRKPEHILFFSPSLKETKNHLNTIILKDKFNL